MTSAPKKCRSLIEFQRSPINSENSQDFLERAKKEEEADQVALHVIELYRANFDLQKDIKEKEAKFERDIKTAWTAPRPPPTTLEQRLDRIALEKIKSKEMFDEFGNQQRPVKTDPQMVVHETGIGIMITHARLNYMQMDYPSMYVYANKAVAAASILEYGPLTARCFYYRGIASYHHGEFAVAKDDFLTSRACAGLYGISSEDIETYIEKTDKAEKAEWAMFERSRAPKAERTPATRSTVVDDRNEPSPTTVDDATTLVDGSPASTEDTALPLSPFSSPAEEERSAENPHEDAKSQNQTFRRPDPLGKFPLGGEQQPGTDYIPNYQPQEEAISEEIRKDILESKVQSLNPVSKASPAEANPQESMTFPPPSMASTEWTLLGSATSQGSTRRVPRPYVAPITTSFPEAMSNPVRQASPDATLVSDSTGEKDGEEMTAASSGARDDATPDSGSTDEIDEDEIMAAFGAEQSGFIGAQGDEFTPVENEREFWTQNYRTNTWTRGDRTNTWTRGDRTST